MTSELKVDKISPASGTSFTLGDSGDTFTVPSGCTITNSGTASGFGGITQSDMWYMTSNITEDVGDITANWSRYTGPGGNIGSALTESSGTFTFPSTGIWQIMFQCQWYYSGDSRWNQCYIKTTTNNSSYTTAGEMYQFVQQTESGSTYAMGTCEVIFDVTDTTQCKVQFHDRVNNDSCGTYGASGYQTTGVTFVRLGDT
jgi:hypothetical protein